MPFKIYPYKAGSASAKALAEKLGCKRLRREGKPIKVKGILINWGCSSDNFSRNIDCDIILNYPECVRIASNKLKTFDALTVAKVNTPDWTVAPELAKEWVRQGPVVARTILNGHSGAGIVMMNNINEFVEAPLYTKYVPKKEEYRLHVMGEEVFFVQRKARNRDVPDDKVNWKVRNHGNGFIFAHQGVDVPDEAKQQAIMAVDALGLDFGAVDLIWNEKQDEYYVLEVNTACGLEGTTLDKYAEAFQRYL